MALGGNSMSKAFIMTVPYFLMRIDRVYIVYGNTEIYLTELKADLTGPKAGRRVHAYDC
jgi:hypothetical protein